MKKKDKRLLFLLILIVVVFYFFSQQAPPPQSITLHGDIRGTELKVTTQQLSPWQRLLSFFGLFSVTVTSAEPGFPDEIITGGLAHAEWQLNIGPLPADGFSASDEYLIRLFRSDSHIHLEEWTGPMDTWCTSCTQQVSLNFRLEKSYGTGNFWIGIFYTDYNILAIVDDTVHFDVIPVPIVCTSHSYSACDGDNVYWYDSCNNREERKDDCNAGDSCGAEYSVCQGSNAVLQRDCIERGCRVDACYSDPFTRTVDTTFCPGGCSGGSCIVPSGDDIFTFDIAGIGVISSDQTTKFFEITLQR